MKKPYSYWFLTVQINENHTLGMTCRSVFSVWSNEVISEAIKLNFPNIINPKNFSVVFAMELTKEQYDDYGEFNRMQ